MSSATGVSGASLEALARRMGELESRVASLERCLRSQDLRAEEPDEPAAVEPVLEALPATGQLAPLFGVSFLGLAGAYTLRALTGMGTIPVAAGVALGLIYASAWLFAASRLTEDQRTATIFRGATASLILIPLLWEAHVRFGALSSPVTAALLVAYAVLGLAVSWRRNLTSLAWITSMSSLLAACALLIVTRDLIPFTWALLGIAVAIEASALMNHWLAERWVVAIAVNLGALLMVLVMSRPGGAPQGYAPISQTGALVTLAGLLSAYLAGTVARTLWRGFEMTKFEIAQCIAAFAIAMGGSLRIAQGSPDAVLTVGLFSAFGGLVCYGISAFFITRHREQDRNFYVYSTFGLLLVIVTGSLLLSGTWLLLMWAALGVAFAALGLGTGRATFQWHGAVFVIAALASSGLLSHGVVRFLGIPHSPAMLPDPGTLIAAAAAAVAYAVVLRRPADASAIPAPGFLVAVFCVSAVWSSAVVAVRLLSPLCSGLNSGAADYCPPMLTATLAAAAFGLAFASRRSGRTEQAWVSWFLLALLTLKILLQDFRHSQNLGLVMSLLLYGGSLVLLPRMLQKSKRMSAADR